MPYGLLLDESDELRIRTKSRGSEDGGEDECPPKPGRRIEGSSKGCDCMACGESDLRLWVSGKAELACTGSSLSRASRELFFLGGGGTALLR